MHTYPVSPTQKEVQLVLPLSLPILPPAIKRDVCRYCHSVHMTTSEFIACREASK